MAFINYICLLGFTDSYPYYIVAGSPASTCRADEANCFCVGVYLNSITVLSEGSITDRARPDDGDFIYDV